MNFKIFLILSLIHASVSVCPDNCLSCSTDNTTCKLCDTLNGFYLSSNSCRPYSGTNCFILSNDGTCLICATGTVFDSTTKACVAMASTAIVDKCLYYGANNQCTQCLKGYAIKQIVGASNSCVVANSIQNCLLYKTVSTCELCESFFYKSYDETKCIPGFLDNCAGSMKSTCRTCKVGFEIKSNFYLTALLQNNQLSEAILHLKKNNYMNLPSINSCTQAPGIVVINNCLVPTGNGNGKCLECNEGFYVNTQGLCSEFTVLNCKTKVDFYYCSECVAGYSLVNKSTCAQNSIPNCKTVAVNNGVITCSVCSTGYVLEAGVCNFKITNCVQYLALTCTTCVENFVPSSDNLICVAKVDLCSTYASSLTIQNGPCKVCATNYALYAANTVCALPIAFCSAHQYTAPTLTCTTCQTGYFLSDNKLHCLVLIQNCIQYNSVSGNSNQSVCSKCGNNLNLLNNQCLVDTCTKDANGNCVVCSAGLQVSTDGKSCVALISNCNLYANPNNKCSQCLTGYQLSENGLFCRTNIANCLTYTTTGDLVKCQTCNNGFYTATDLSTCFLSIEGCKDHSNGLCLNCNVGWHLDQNFAKCYVDIPLCQVYQNALCGICLPTAHLSADKKSCILLIEFCAQMTDAQICTECISGYHLSKDTKSCLIDIAYCKVNLELICGECLAGYKLSTDQGRCYLVIPNCNIQNNDNCVECAKNYHVSNDKKSCFTNNIVYCLTYSDLLCLTCLAGKTTSADGLTCNPITTNCQTYVNNVCTACIAGYNLSINSLTCFAKIDNCVDQTNQLCNNCDVNFVLAFDGSQCYGAIANCVDQTNNECLQCADTYTPLDNLSQCLFIQDCQSYIQLLSYPCGVCKIGFIKSFNGLTCTSSILNCLVFNADGSACVSCKAGFNVQNLGQSCVVNNCLIQSLGVCSSCETNFVLLNNVCLSAIAHCDTIEFEGVCKTCSTNFLLSSDKKSCFAKIANCSQQADDKCNLCENNFSPSADKTACNLQINNCKTTAAGVCTECNTGYNLSINSLTCFAKIVNCTNQTNQLCNNCDVNFVLAFDGTQCYGAIANCVDQTNNECFQCANTYTPLDNLTQCLFIQDCQSYIQTFPSSCGVCNSGFTVSADGLTCTSNLSLFVDIGKTTCIPGYVLSADGQTCYAVISFCQTQVDDLCSVCNAGYHVSINDKKCFQDIVNCADNADNLCNQCNPDSVLSNDMKTCTPSNCKTISGSNCSECEAGFFLKTNFHCTLAIQNCKVQNDTACTECNTGFTLTGARLCQ